MSPLQWLALYVEGASMKLEDLLFVKRMLDSGTAVSDETWRRVLETAIAALEVPAPRRSGNGVKP